MMPQVGGMAGGIQEAFASNSNASGEVEVGEHLGCPPRTSSCHPP